MTNTHKHYETARRAYNWTSFHPEKRAASECAFYDEIMAEFSDSPQVQAKFDRLFLLSLAAKSRCMSSMITGPARFPVAKAERANNRERKISDEMMSFIDRVRKAKARDAYYEAHPEARPINSADSDAVERLQQKLEAAKKYHTQLKEVKALIKKGASNEEASAKAGLSSPVAWHSFNIQYANKAVKDLKAKITSMTAAKAKPSTESTINGVRVVENTEAMRLQIFFNGKPEREIIDLLKRHAFKWSPSNMAWQRQLTNNTIYAFTNNILPALKQQSAV